MTTKFLKHIWPSQGFYCTAHPVKKPDGGFFYKHGVFTTIDSAVAASKAADAIGKDCFMAIGTLKEKFVTNEETDKRQWRVHTNMGWFKSLIFDIDCGEGKPYKTQNDALKHLKEFCQATLLPFPTVVNSGGGIHAYFTLEEDITSDEWFELAVKLKAVAKWFGLDADDSRTTDKSSVLRVVGTHNHKKALARPVKVLKYGEHTRVKRITSLLNAVIEEHNLHIKKARKVKPKPNADFKIPDSLNNAFLHTQNNVYESVDGKTVLEKCNTMKEVHACGGDCYEPVWYRTLQVDRHFDDPDPYALSTGYEGFNEAEMLSKIANLERNNVGATTCELFQELTSSADYNTGKGCEGCPYIGRIRSPKELGLRVMSGTEYNEKAKAKAEAEAEAEAEEVVAKVEVVEPYNIQDENEDVFAGMDTGSDFGGGDVDMKEIGFEMEPEEPTPKKPDTPESTTPKTLKTDYGFDVPFPEPPYPYTHSPAGIFQVIEDEETGMQERTEILGFDIVPLELRAEKLDGNHSVLMEAQIPNESVGRIFEIPFEILVEDKAIIRLLASKGVIAKSRRCSDALQDYMKNYILEIQKLTKTVQKYNQLGWHDDGAMFVLPEETLLKDGTREASGVSKGLTHAVGSFRKNGTLEEWKKIIDVYSRPGYEPFAFGHLGGYGSLLFKFTDYEGAIISMVGDSGSGKSTVLYTINSIFGHHKEALLVQTDTYLARMNRLGIFNSICVTYDEITNIEDEQLSELCYSVTQGRGKHRLTQNAEAKENTTSWQMLMVASSNETLHGKLAGLKHNSSAESLRVFEYRIDTSLHQAMSKDDKKIFENLKHNFGHAGEIFVNYVIQHPEEVQALISDLESRFEIAANITGTPERYWGAVVSCTLAGGVIANKLGLCTFDIDKLFNWSVAQTISMRSIVADNTTDPIGLLNEFLGQHQQSMMVVSDGKISKNSVYVERPPRVSLLIRADITSQKVYINKTAIRSWLKKGGGDYHAMKTSLKATGILIDENVGKTLSAGSKLFPTGQVKCWLIDMDHAAMKETGVVRSINSSKKDDIVKELDGVDKDETG